MLCLFENELLSQSGLTWHGLLYCGGILILVIVNLMLNNAEAGKVFSICLITYDIVHPDGILLS